MTPAKRLLDLSLALILGLALFPPLALLIVVLVLVQGRPIFHASERMSAPNRPFRLWKLRTMRPDPDDAGVSGGDKAVRVTPIGRILRRTRIDEIPQLWNILRGEMSFVGPRPPLRFYVERFPEIYAKVLRNRPGLTGLATLHFHRHEARLIKSCGTAGQTDAIYTRRCIPRKAKLDLIYQRHQSLRLDLALMLATPLHLAGISRRWRTKLAARLRTRPPARPARGALA